MGSLLDEELRAEASGQDPGPRGPGLLSRVVGVLRLPPLEIVQRVAGLVSHHRLVSAGALSLVLAGIGVGAWLHYRIEPPPDYDTARLDVLFEYTLLTDDFNRLPVEERIALIGQLIERLKAMGSGDSVLLAMFASMIMGEMRVQIEENLSRLAVDVADKYAVSYDPNAPEADRTAYLEDAFIGMQRMFTVIDQGLAEKSDEEMLEDGRRQARRDLRRFEQGRVGADEMIRVFDIMNNKVGAHMSGHEKVRVQTMFRDMTRMLRAEP